MRGQDNTADARMWIRYDKDRVEAATIHEYFHHIDHVLD